MCLVKSIIANLCPIMIHFCALDFNMCRSEEVISFSVYISLNLSSHNEPVFHNFLEIFEFCV